MIPTQSLGEIRYELATRLGFVTSGSMAVAQSVILNSIIREAQNFIYWHLTDERIFKRYEKQADGLGQQLFDLPDDFEPRKPFAIWWRAEKSPANKWRRLTREKLFSDDAEESGDLMNTPHAISQANSTPSGIPSIYRLVGDKLEILPATEDRNDWLRIEYTQSLPRLTQDADLLLMDSAPVLALSLANAKAHYQQPDAGQYSQQFERLIRQLRAGAHSDKRYAR
ncbi:hypothetical protein [Thiothrix sp.]|jgi:hypothetical protein|uniref:hypothetical protein n=1 Tax=Thiothrix sp. TaxID=1032 RepID=UPI00257DC85E|nr:hypothetical protein [Thiothrix sp.]